MMGVGPPRGAGFSGINACAPLRWGTCAGTDCTCTDFAILATSWDVDMVPVFDDRGASEFCHSCSDSRMNCSTVDSGFGESDFSLTVRGLLANATRCVVDRARGFRCDAAVFGPPGVFLVVCVDFFRGGLS